MYNQNYPGTLQNNNQSVVKKLFGNPFSLIMGIVAIAAAIPFFCTWGDYVPQITKMLPSYLRLIQETIELESQQLERSLKFYEFFPYYVPFINICISLVLHLFTPIMCIVTGGTILWNYKNAKKNKPCIGPSVVYNIFSGLNVIVALAFGTAVISPLIGDGNSIIDVNLWQIEMIMMQYSTNMSSDELAFCKDYIIGNINEIIIYLVFNIALFVVFLFCSISQFMLSLSMTRTIKTGRPLRFGAVPFAVGQPFILVFSLLVLNFYVEPEIACVMGYNILLAIYAVYYSITARKLKKATVAPVQAAPVNYDNYNGYNQPYNQPNNYAQVTGNYGYGQPAQINYDTTPQPAGENITEPIANVPTSYETIVVPPAEVPQTAPQEIVQEVVQEVATEKPEPVVHAFCSECGAKLNEADMFCKQCGTKVYR